MRDRCEERGGHTSAAYLRDGSSEPCGKPVTELGTQHSHARRGHRGRNRGSLRPQRAQPTSGEPRTRNRKLQPAAIQTNKNIRRRRHRRMTQGAMTVAIEPDLSRNDGQGCRLTLRADHDNTSGTKGQQETQTIQTLKKVNCNLLWQEISRIFLLNSATKPKRINLLKNSFCGMKNVLILRDCLHTLCPPTKRR